MVYLILKENYNLPSPHLPLLICGTEIDRRVWREANATILEVSNLFVQSQW
jgi:hypothetical protein